MANHDDDKPNYIDHEHNRAAYYNDHDDFDNDPSDNVADIDNNDNLTADDFHDGAGDDDHRCDHHDGCRLVHLKHRSTGWWFEYHVHSSGVILATVHDGTSFGHDDHPDSATDEAPSDRIEYDISDARAGADLARALGDCCEPEEGMSEAVVLRSECDHEVIAISGHAIQYGGAEGGWCSEHNSFECIEKLTPEECQAVAAAKPVLSDKEVDALTSALRRVEELRGAATNIAEFIFAAIGTIEDEGEKAHVIEMVINRLHHGLGRTIGPEGSVSEIIREATEEARNSDLYKSLIGKEDD